MRQFYLENAKPESLALACALGASIAIIPILGVTTFICVLAGLTWRLNQPALQTLNFLFYPLQLILLPLFLSAGAAITHSEEMPFSLSAIANQFMADPKQFLMTYGVAGFHALIVWAIVAPIVFWVVYRFSLKLFLRRKAYA